MLNDHTKGLDMKNLIIKSSILLIVALCIFLYTKSNARGEYLMISGLAQGTTYNITFEAGKKKVTREDIDSLLKDFDMSLSAYDDSSLIARINRNEEGVIADRKFTAVFNKSFEVFTQTGGAFDITVAPVVSALGFGPGDTISFDSVKIDSLARYIGMEKVKLEGSRLIKEDPNIKLDMNAIAQGYSVDIVCDFLNSMGIRNYLVEIGGEVRAKGRNSLNEVWRVGIDKPVENNIPGSDLQAIVRLDNKAMATSGNYRRFFEKEGVKYVHTINPETGYPVLSNLLSATVIAKDCMTADAYATAFMVMGLERSLEFLEANRFLDVYFIYGDTDGSFQVKMTPGIGRYLQN